MPRRAPKPENAEHVADPGPRRYKTGRDAHTHAEVQQLLAARHDLETLALLHLALATGMRREDVVSVERANVHVEVGPKGNVERLRIRFWEHKKRRDWEVQVGPPGAAVLHTWMLEHPKARWLFPGKHYGGGHLASRTAYDYYQAALKRARLRPRPFHALRATCIKLCKRAGWTKEQVMDQTGDSWRTIEEHYATPSEDEMREVVTERPLIGRTLPPAAVPDPLNAQSTEETQHART